MKNSEKKIRNDIILALTILTLALTVFLVFKACAREGSYAVITVNGEVYKTVPLDTDTAFDVVSGKNGEYKNTVTVKDGKVFITYANCPDGICERHRAIKYHGESIACLPHGLVVTVEGGEENDVDIGIK